MEALTFIPLKTILRSTDYKFHEVYKNACIFFGAPLIDRTKTLDAGEAFEVLDPLQTQRTDKTFAESSDLRAASLVSLALESQRKIQVLWSGGIDSTLALCALEKALNKVNSLHLLDVLLSKESIDEYPRFYKDIIENKITHKLYTPPIYKELSPDKIVVSGELGDQLFGSDKLKYHVQTGEAFRPYTDVLPYLIDRKLGIGKAEKLMAYLAPQIEKSPIKIITLYDYLWWMNFSMKWQHVSLRLIKNLPEESFILNENYFNFFQSKTFEAWSISQPTLKINETWPSYKQVAKEYIYETHQDKDYLMNKEKEQSLKEVIFCPSLIARIKRNFTPKMGLA